MVKTALLLNDYLINGMFVSGWACHENVPHGLMIGIIVHFFWRCSFVWNWRNFISFFLNLITFVSYRWQDIVKRYLTLYSFAEAKHAKKIERSYLVYCFDLMFWRKVKRMKSLSLDGSLDLLSTSLLIKSTFWLTFFRGSTYW